MDTNVPLRFGRAWHIPEYPKLQELEFSITNGGGDKTDATRILTIFRDYYTKHKDRLVEIRKHPTG